MVESRFWAIVEKATSKLAVAMLRVEDVLFAATRVAHERRWKKAK